MLIFDYNILKGKGEIMALIDKYLILMTEMGASDLHFNSGNVPIWRIYGDIKKLKMKKL